MKKNIIYYLLPWMLLLAACSEDEVNPDPQLGGPLYGLTPGEPGSVDELIYKTWEYCGVYYLYDYAEYAFQLTNWSGRFEKWYTPVKEENKELVRNTVEVIQNEVLGRMDGDYIRRNWFVRVFLCDSLCDASSFDRSKLVPYYLKNEDLLIIPNVGEVMKNYTAEDWAAWKKEFSNLLIGRLYLGASEQPDAFFDLRCKKPGTTTEVAYLFADELQKDPDGKYSDVVYSFRLMGYVNKRTGASHRVVDKQTDVADYIIFLTTTEKSELDYTWEHFPMMLKRTVALVPYLRDILGLDVAAMQNASCPDDPVEADYFTKLKI